MAIFSRLGVLLIGVSLAIVPRPAVAGPFEDGIIAYAQGKYVDAIQLLRPVAEDGNADARLILGSIYQDGGFGVPRNSVHAYVWFALAMVSADPASKDFQIASEGRDKATKAMTSSEIKLAEEAVHQCAAQHYKNCD
jgi:hypothetical protein